MKGQQQLDLSVVTVNWNSLAITSEALDTLRTQTSGIVYEVIVIDNGTTKDASVSELPKRFPWVVFRAITPNQGFAHPNNLGIALAQGRYVVLLNNDTIQIENALGKAVRYMDEHADVGALGILHRYNDPDRSVQASYHRFPNPWHEALGLVGLSAARETGGPDPANLIERDVDWVVGSFLLMRRECLEDVGLLDERFFIYDEDIDWCYRAKAKNWTIRFWPGAQMIHLGNATMRWMKDKTFMHYRSHLTYLAKNHSRLAAAAYYLALSARMTAGTAKQALRLVVGRGSMAELRERFRRQVSFLRMDETRSGN